VCNVAVVVMREMEEAKKKTEKRENRVYAKEEREESEIRIVFETFGGIFEI
jgi:hypothetical protein